MTMLLKHSNNSINYGSISSDEDSDTINNMKKMLDDNDSHDSFEDCIFT